MENSTKSPEIEIEILPYIYHILRSIEKDQTEITTKHSQECSQKVLELQKQLEVARNQIKALPGIDLNKEDQLQKLENLRNQLVLKQDLIKKYKDIQF
ncbi:mediator of RNA polymerase II transcription subunit 9 [Culicoides brevitarsis]|uniref:mediator of RNA polymerase II transcription subunit 9 n=1 Tax=Culicoides brevitarsis TaxID=469753 RepID=UPI00307C3A86